MSDFLLVASIIFVGFIVILALGLFFLLGWSCLCGFVGIYNHWISQSTMVAILSDFMIVVLFIMSACLFVDGNGLFLLPAFALGILCFIRFSHYTEFRNIVPKDACINTSSERHFRSTHSGSKYSSLLKWVGVGFLLSYLMRDKDDDYINPTTTDETDSVNDCTNDISSDVPDNTIDDFGSFDD